MNPKTLANSNQRYHIRAVARALVLPKIF
jgi:hypothetical protein